MSEIHIQPGSNDEAFEWPDDCNAELGFHNPGKIKLFDKRRKGHFSYALYPIRSSHIDEIERGGERTITLAEDLPVTFKRSHQGVVRVYFPQDEVVAKLYSVEPRSEFPLQIDNFSSGDALQLHSQRPNPESEPISRLLSISPIEQPNSSKLRVLEVYL